MHLTELIDTYCQAWSHALPVRRSELMEKALAPTATYTDPTVHTIGLPDLLTHISKVIARRPGSRVIRTSLVDVHHGVARFAWRAVEASGNELPEGLDIAFLSPDGKQIERIIGFFGPLKHGG